MNSEILARPPSHRAVAVPELLLFYLQGLSQKDLAASAIVCKGWSALATDALWRTTTIRFTVLLQKLRAVMQVHRLEVSRGLCDKTMANFRTLLEGYLHV